MDTGKVLYEQKADTRRAMASTTKIMTAILVLESGVDLDSTVKVSSRAAGTWEVSKWVSAGDKVTVRQLLYALMLRSANGAAVALAENDAGSVSAFVEEDEREGRGTGHGGHPLRHAQRAGRGGPLLHRRRHGHCWPATP